MYGTMNSLPMNTLSFSVGSYTPLSRCPDTINQMSMWYIRSTR